MSFDFNVAYSSCWGYSLINTLKLKKNPLHSGILPNHFSRLSYPPSNAFPAIFQVTLSRRIRRWHSSTPHPSLSDGHADVRKALTNDNDDDADDGHFDNTLGEILGASFRDMPSVDLDLACGAVDSNVDLACTRLLSPPSHLPPPLPSVPSYAAAEEPFWDLGVFTIIIIFSPYWWLSWNQLFSFSRSLSLFSSFPQALGPASKDFFYARLSFGTRNTWAHPLVQLPWHLRRIPFPFLRSPFPASSIFSSSASRPRFSSFFFSPPPIPARAPCVTSLLFFTFIKSHSTVPCPFLADIACHYVTSCRSLISVPPPSLLVPSATGSQPEIQKFSLS